MSDKEGSSVLAENVRPRETPLLVNITAAAGAFAFGLWGLAVKLSSILGPVSYGLVSWISRGDHRLAIQIQALDHSFTGGVPALRKSDGNGALTGRR